MFFSLKIGFGYDESIFSSPNDSVQSELYSVYLSSNFNSCPERLCEEISQIS